MTFPAPFFKFPSTPHLAVPGGTDLRDDKVFTQEERDEFLLHELVVEEKIDGANLGISFDTGGNPLVQNRGEYLQPPFEGQWKKLGEWLSLHLDPLFDNLSDRYTLFGEWCYARHSIFYDRLPDWFIGFDLYDRKTDIFLPTSVRDAALARMGIPIVPLIACGHFTLQELTTFFVDSQFGSAPAEGLYLRCNGQTQIENRAKLVRPHFIQSTERHWSRSRMEPNSLCCVTGGPRQQGSQ